MRAKRGEPSQKAIVAPAIKSARTYLIALHELGHVLGPDQNGRRIEGEIGAWEWALANARCKITPGIRKMIARSLGSYIERYRSGYGYGAKQAWLPSETDRPDVLKRLQRLGADVSTVTKEDY